MTPELRQHHLRDLRDLRDLVERLEASARQRCRLPASER
jgi:hypothetical protein